MVPSSQGTRTALVVQALLCTGSGAQCLSGYSALAYLPRSMWDLSSPTRDQPKSPALESGFLTAGPPEKLLSHGVCLPCSLLRCPSPCRLSQRHRLTDHTLPQTSYTCPVAACRSVRANIRAWASRSWAFILFNKDFITKKFQIQKRGRKTITPIHTFPSSFFKNY